VAITGRS